MKVCHYCNLTKSSEEERSKQVVGSSMVWHIRCIFKYLREVNNGRRERDTPQHRKVVDWYNRKFKRM